MPSTLAKQYEVLGKVGEGTYGEVYKARAHSSPGTLLAIKTFKAGKARLLAAAKHCRALLCQALLMPPVAAQAGEGVSPTAIREISLLKALQHQNIVRLVTVHVDRQVLTSPPTTRSKPSLAQD